MAKKKDTVKVTHEPHKFPFPLSEESKAAVATELASAIQEIESLDGEKKSVVAEYNGRVKVVQQRIHTLSYKVTSGEEMRSVDCELKLNYTKLIATLVRLDTQEVVNDRPMTDEERQMTFDDCG